MFVYFKYFVLIVCFNHCFGDSNLIRTAIFSPPLRHPQNGFHRINAGQLKSDATHYLPVYSLPLGSNPNPEELHYSSSVAQPTVGTSKGRAKMVNFQIMGQNPRSQIKQVDNGKQVEQPKVRYIPSRTNLRITAPPYLPTTKAQTSQVVNQKPMMLKTQISATTLTSMAPNSYIMNSNVRSLDSNKKSNTTVGPRVHSLRFNWPKARPQTQQNETQTQRSESKEVPKLSFQRSSTDLQKNEYPRRQHYGESQQYFRFDSTKESEKFDIKTPVELLRETTTPLPIETMTSFETTSTTPLMTTEPPKEEIPDSNKKESLSTVDSELSYETQPYDSYKINEENRPEIPYYGSPISDNTGIAIPENEVNYAHPEPEPEHEIGEQYVDPYEKDSYDETMDTTPQLKSLLEQFIQQLDLLKFVAAKELQKTSLYPSIQSPTYSSDGKVMNREIEPSIAKTNTNYDEYQNERSFEQNLSNSEGKSYKDTYDKTPTNGRKPCKKPFHLGAMPHLGHHHY